MNDKQTDNNGFEISLENLTFDGFSPDLINKGSNIEDSNSTDSKSADKNSSEDTEKDLLKKGDTIPPVNNPSARSSSPAQNQEYNQPDSSQQNKIPDDFGLENQVPENPIPESQIAENQPPEISAPETEFLNEENIAEPNENTPPTGSQNDDNQQQAASLELSENVYEEVSEDGFKNMDSAEEIPNISEELIISDNNIEEDSTPSDIPSNIPSDNIGFCGKIPGHGDFVSRNIPDEFMFPWNQWVQTVVGVSQEQQENLWLQTFLTSPVWRFAMSPGVCGAYGMIGIMIPSVDRVGRYYPFTLASQSYGDPLHHLINDEEWYNNSEDLIISALEDDIKIDSLVESSTNIPFPMKPKQQQEQHQTTSNYDNGIPGNSKSNWSLPINSSAKKDIKDALPGFFSIALQEIFKNHSLWWTNGSENIAPTLLICEGLPPISGYSAMLDGNWEEWGWPRHQVLNY